MNDKKAEENDEKHGLKRYFSITLVLLVVTMSVFAVAFVLFPSESRLIQIANMVVQLSGILIGFIGIAVFYFLGTISSLRDRVTGLQAAVVTEIEIVEKGRNHSKEARRHSLV